MSGELEEAVGRLRTAADFGAWSKVYDAPGVSVLLAGTKLGADLRLILTALASYQERFCSSVAESSVSSNGQNSAGDPLDWKRIEDSAPPAERGYIKVRTITTYRWQAYKPDGVRQMRKAGRWQVIGEYGGWDNADLPERGDWMPYEPGRTAPPSQTEAAQLVHEAGKSLPIQTGEKP